MIIPLQLLPPQTQTLTLALLPSLNRSPKPHPKILLNCLIPLQTPSPLTPHLTTTTAAAADPPQPTSDFGLRFREKLLYLQTLKVNPSKALYKNPNFRSAPFDSLKSVEKCFFSMGIDHSALGRIFDLVYKKTHINLPDHTVVGFERRKHSSIQAKLLARFRGEDKASAPALGVEWVVSFVVADVEGQRWGVQCEID
ncbi:hypothetical protein LOK49_LG11G01428 [Camellia lanceoleosa]|uniref:Uncharacterized protein n=1 Tax=Camellia lanceoleosa TaxID=1840588 RepID=A0ACC0FZ78_9ERIC|nr:hypothetical protein LOK49_LG11G01428 [Camellia lanceoleosa]